MRILILADHAYRDVPGLASVAVQLWTLQPEWDIRIVDTHLFSECVELFKPHLVVVTNLHDPEKNKICDKVRRRGGLIVLHPAEGRPNTDGLAKWVADFQPEYCDLYLSWTQILADMIPKSIQCFVTGSPRMDFYFEHLNRLVMSKQQMCDMYGLDINKPIITVASSFPQAKFSQHSRDFLEDDWKKLGRDRVEGDEKPFESAKREWDSFTMFQAWLLILARECRDYQIIIKPHPSENMSYWNDFAKGIGAELMMTDYIFNLLAMSTVHIARVSCVTLPEAWILGIPTVATYFGEPISGATAEANNIPLVANSSKFFSEMVRESFEATDGAWLDTKSDYVAKWLGNMPGSAKRIAGAIYDFLNKRMPKTHSEPSADDLVALHRLLVDHSRQNAQPKIDHIGQFGKTCRLEQIQQWTRDIQNETHQG